MKPQYRSLVCFFLLSSLALAQPQHPHKKSTKAAQTTRPKTDPAATIHQSALIINTHADTPQRFLNENFNLGQNTPISNGHIDLKKIKQNNLKAKFFSIWMKPKFKGH